MASTIRFINPAGLYDPAPNGYSHVATVDGPARLVFIAGQGGEDARGVLSEDFATQLDQALDNLATALAAADAGFGDVAKLTVLIVDHSESRLELLSAAVKRRWVDRPAPACTLIPVPRLAVDGMLVEIDATVALAR